MPVDRTAARIRATAQDRRPSDDHLGADQRGCAARAPEGEHQVEDAGLSDYLSSHELADLIGCKHNQRAIMIRWLARNHWKFAVDMNGIPKVARGYHERKMGLTSDIRHSNEYDDTPNLDAFK